MGNQGTKSAREMSKGVQVKETKRNESAPEKREIVAKRTSEKRKSTKVKTEKEAGGTYRFQKDLEKLPIPTLEDTCARFLSTVGPLLSEEELAETKAAVTSFQEDVGPEMQACLEAYAKDKDNYVDAFWDDAYLLMDDPVVINVNPFFVLEDDPTPSRNNQITRATQLVWSICKFVRAIRSETVEVDMVRKTPLCMSQFKKLFGSARIPHGRGPGSDKIETCSESKHIVVICRNQFYTFDVVSSDGAMLVSLEELHTFLEAVKEEAQEQDNESCARDAFGVFTSETRTTWAKYRAEIASLNPHNASELRVIDEALFVLCLDMNSPESLSQAAANALRGTSEINDDGIEIGTCMSRWYDKLQFIVSENGSASVCFEHTPADGHTVLRMVSDVFTDTIIKFAQAISGKGAVKNHLQSVRYERSKSVTSGSESSSSSSHPRKIELELNDSLRQGITQAHAHLVDLIDRYKITSLEYRGYGKKFITSNNLSPDAFVQQSMMASVFKVTGEIANTYESVMTKRYLLGRTEAGRSVTYKAREYVELMNGDGEKPSPGDVVNALRDATKAHSAMTALASQGQGVDRHLYALKCAWKQAHPDEELPALFSTPGYAKLGTTILSTSNCGNPALKLFGFGPVSLHGIGIGYIIKDDGLSFSICSQSIPVDEVSKALVVYLDEIKKTLKQHSQRKSVRPGAIVRKIVKG